MLLVWLSVIGVLTVGTISTILVSVIDRLKNTVLEQEKQLQAQQRVIFHLYSSKAKIETQLRSK